MRPAARHERIVRETFEPTTHVYTDGSGEHGRFGAASFVVNPHVLDGQYEGVLIPLGTKSTAFRAEATALLRTLETMPHGHRVHVWTDSQALLRAVNASSAEDAQIRSSQARWAALGGDVKISWVPGHWNIYGNEEADERAKAAAAMDCNDEWEEAATLRLRAVHVAGQRWQERWEAGKKGADFRKVNRLRTGGARKLYKGLSRAAVSAMTQLRSGYIGLNRYLKWRHITNDPRCDRCHEDETREHLLFSCCRARSIRRKLEEDIGTRRARSTWALLNSRDLVPKVVAFVTKRFSAYKNH